MTLLTVVVAAAAAVAEAIVQAVGYGSPDEIRIEHFPNQ